MARRRLRRDADVGPALVRAQAPDPGIDSLQLRRDRGKKLLISGGLIGGVGLLATAIGFGVVAGMHASNPGVGKEFIFAPGQDPQSLLRMANGMEMAGMVGASMLLTGIVLAAVGGRRPHAAPDPGLALQRRVRPALGEPGVPLLTAAKRGASARRSRS